MTSNSSLLRSIECDPWINPVVIPGLRAGTCAVLRGSSLIVLIVQVRLTFCEIKNYFTLLFLFCVHTLPYLE